MSTEQKTSPQTGQSERLGVISFLGDKALREKMAQRMLRPSALMRKSPYTYTSYEDTPLDRLIPLYGNVSDSDQRLFVRNEYGLAAPLQRVLCIIHDYEQASQFVRMLPVGASEEEQHGLVLQLSRAFVHQCYLRGGALAEETPRIYPSSLTVSTACRLVRHHFYEAMQVLTTVRT